MQKFNITDNKKLFCLISIVIIYMLFQVLNFTGKNLLGDYRYLLSASEIFGMPSELRENGYVEPLFKHALGWDGQFYYYISNDLLSEEYKGEVLQEYYRYQRIGVPFLAKILSLLSFQSNVSVPIYLLTSLILICLAMYVLGKYLIKHKLSVLWILPWVLSLGVQQSWRHGLIDSGSDALLIISLVMLLERRFVLYSIAMVFTCLAKELYITVAFVIFLINIPLFVKFPFFIKKPYKNSLKYFLLFALPGIIFIFWHAYLITQFGLIKSGLFSGFLTIPFKSFFKYMSIAYDNSNGRELLFLFIYAFTVIYAFIVAVLASHKNKIFISLLPIVIICACYNDIVLCHLTGYMKNTSVLLALIPIMFTYIKLDANAYTKFLRYSMIILMVFITGSSVITTYKMQDFSNTGFCAMFERDSIKQESPLTNYNGEIEVLERYPYMLANIPFKEFFTDYYEIVKVRIKNNGVDTWQRNSFTCLSYHWFIDNNFNQVILDGTRSALPKDVAPDETVDALMLVHFPSAPVKNSETGGGRPYTLRLTMVQDGVKWFYSAGNLYKDINMVLDK